MFPIPENQFPHFTPCDGILVICGSAACVWDDLKRCQDMYLDMRYDVMAINDMIMHFPGVLKHAYSNDNIWLPKWVAARRDLLIKEYGEIEFVHSCHDYGLKWPWPSSGTSALSAVYTGLKLGYDRIYLCGIPLDDSPHYFEPPWRTSNFLREVPHKGNGKIKYWADAYKNVFNGRVKAMSGRLRDL